MHLAQINITRMLRPINNEVMAGFVARLDDINTLADGWPGFVWRLQGEGNNATDLQYLQTRGPTPHAFTFAKPFEALEEVTL